jgi:uncharacterized protein (DUF736 family)
MGKGCSSSCNPKTKGELTMIIGNFTEQNGTYTGELVTLAARQSLTFEPSAAGEKVDYRITANGVEVGAAWKRTSEKSDRDYLSVKLDSPFIPTPIYAALIHQEDGKSILVWSRSEDRKEDRNGN